MQWGRSRYVSTFPWKDFLMGWIRKIQKIKKERMEERKRRVISSSFFNFFYECGGSHTGVFSQEHPRATALVQPSSGEPTHMGTSPTT